MSEDKIILCGIRKNAGYGCNYQKPLNDDKGRNRCIHSKKCKMQRDINYDPEKEKVQESKHEHKIQEITERDIKEAMRMRRWRPL